MKKALIFVMVALMALASTGCGTYGPMAARTDSASDLHELRKEGYTLEYGQGRDMKTVLANVYQRANTENKKILVGRAERKGNLNIAKNRAHFDALVTYSENMESKVVGVEKLYVKDYSDRFIGEYSNHIAQIVNNTNLEEVGVFINKRTKSAVILYLADMQ